jgi:acyl carrier protein
MIFYRLNLLSVNTTSPILLELKDLILQIAELFEETDVDIFTSETKFKELDEWSSLIALSIIAMVDEGYDVNFKGDDIKHAITINDLYNVFQLRRL